MTIIKSQKGTQRKTQLHLPGNPRILPRDEHCISRKFIDSDALKVMHRLNRHGHLAFLVGGGVRDLLLGKAPKDFDIGTSATPEEVRSLFRNSRTIGRRFRLNHIFFQGNKIIEVSTFRQEATGETAAESGRIASDNTYGDAETDAFRRDLTINGLFYDLGSFSIIDYVGGIDDLEQKVIRIIGEPKIRIEEDPVRMIRVVRHAARTGFTIHSQTFDAVCSSRELIELCPSARVYEEFIREVKEGFAVSSFRLLESTGLLEYLVPPLWEALQENHELVSKRLFSVLSRLDEMANQRVDLPSSVFFPALMIGNFPEDFFVLKTKRGGLSPVSLYFELNPPSLGEDVDLRKSAEPQLEGVLSDLFKGLGVPKRQRERMEQILIARLRVLSPDADFEEELAGLAGKGYFEELVFFLRLTCEDSHQLSVLEDYDVSMRPGARPPRRGPRGKQNERRGRGRGRRGSRRENND